MKRRNAYLLAAQEFSNKTNINRGCCDVLARILGNYEIAYVLPELLLFKPRKRLDGLWWWHRDNAEVRILALCFMAEIAGDN